MNHRMFTHPGDTSRHNPEGGIVITTLRNLAQRASALVVLVTIMLVGGATMALAAPADYLQADCAQGASGLAGSFKTLSTSVMGIISLIFFAAAVFLLVAIVIAAITGNGDKIAKHGKGLIAILAFTLFGGAILAFVAGRLACI